MAEPCSAGNQFVIMPLIPQWSGQLRLDHLSFQDYLQDK